MIREGAAFFAPVNNIDNNIQEFRNFKRTNEEILGEDVVRLDDLNKSDYLYQTVILFILRKIDRNKGDNSERLYGLIKNIEKLMDDIYLFENGLLSDDKGINAQTIKETSKSIAYRCVKERIFDND